MGVRGLQTFIENQCPDACKSVSIQQLAEEHRSRYNCQPVLVVDGMSLINRLYSRTLEWIFGGQWVQFVKQLEDFIGLFRSIDVKLVFFFDGTVCASKRREWVNRRITKYRQITAIFSEIETNFCEPDQKLFQLPTALGSLTRFALKEIGAEVYQTDREADEVIAEYASKNQEVFAVLSQDSDFIIYNTKLYLSLLHLNLNSLTTILYDRNCFALKYLQLYVNQLPLFACLAGNDIISFDKVRNFHRYLSNNKMGRVFLSDFAENLATVISREGWTGNLNNKHELHDISIKICGNPSLSHLIYTGLKSYSVESVTHSPKICINLHPSMEKEIYERHLQCLNLPYIFNLLCNLEYESSEVLEDSTRLPSALVYRKIRQRCYGVVFDYFSSQDYSNNRVTKDGKPILIKEWCAYQGNLMEKPEYIQPTPLKFHNQLKKLTLNIERLWFQYTDVEKMMLFWSILEIPMEFDLLLSIPKQFIVLACVLNYLISGLDTGPLLKPLDVAVFIIQALWSKNVKELEELQVPWVDVSAVNLSTLFMRGVTAIVMVLNICGNPFPITFAMPWKFFDGKLFHYLYIKARDKPSVYAICHQKNEIIKDFHWLLPIITKNTPYDIDKINWSHILEDFYV